MPGIIKGYENINIGCSHFEMIPNWLGITIWGGNYSGLVEVDEQNDIKIYKHNIGGFVINHNVNDGLPFENESVKNLYSSHFIEHLSYEESRKFLKESFRILSPNNTIRIVCPDVSIWIEKIYKNKDKKFFSEYKKSLDEDYWENYLYNQKDYLKTNIQIFNSMIYNWGHKWMWDFESLKIELEEVGFTNVKKCKHLEGNLYDLKNIENVLPSEKIKQRNLESIFIEASKPSK